MVEDEIRTIVELKKKKDININKIVTKATAYDLLTNQLKKGQYILIAPEEINRLVEIGGVRVRMYLESISDWRKE